MGTAELDRLCVNALRFLAVDMIERAKSGHPGLPLGAAPMAYVLWSRHLRHSPQDPDWPDRDRFVLSAGHGSALLYALLHLFGYLPLEELQNFRQWGSRTPGHPEAGLTPGVEVTTGPLGQGFANAVGMAMAEAHLAALFNRPGFPIVDHRTYVLASDGDLMEGVVAEAASLAGHLKLGKLIVLYDQNFVSLAGSTALAFTEDVRRRFEACGWQVLEVPDGNDLEAIDAALQEAKAERERPSLICVRTVIGYGAPTKAGTFHAHGAPLGPEEARAAKRNLGWPEEPPFYVPEEVRAHFAELRARAEAGAAAWHRLFSEYEKAYPELAREFRRRMRGELPAGWEEGLPVFAPGTKVSTRKASEAVLQALGERIPELVGGSADLNPSCFTWLKGKGDFQAPPDPGPVQGAVGGGWGYFGRNLHFGVREHAMGAIALGMARHGGVLPFCGTFLVFSDYMRPPIRLAAMSHTRVVFVFTHDSVAVGEDGPTHQPVEQLMNLRCVPNLVVIRPADANEVREAWVAALRRREGPTALVLTRQDVPVLDRTGLAGPENLHRGGYVLWQAREGEPDVILIGTGSEVALALEAGRKLAEEGVNARVVALPSFELFLAQPEEYREAVLPKGVRARVAVEAGCPLGWERFVGLDGAVVGLSRFGASAPGPVALEKLGITVEAVVRAARRVLAAAP
ncbi:MAG: transketolase [Candidatus Bipolaricaulota bacterium]|nr:transketolase [Candidatus Bipolaricaulota bacterium]MCX7844007.1 transketolase [Candidatus Bipolaricaulota bacterium]MDW8151761.1 transketolase [Candidatus Bipolaricaulota bacterium]